MLKTFTQVHKVRYLFAHYYVVGEKYKTTCEMRHCADYPKTYIGSISNDSSSKEKAIFAFI